MRLKTRLECVGSSPRVSGVYQDSVREFTGRLPGVAEGLAESWEAHWEFARISPKVSGRSLGTCWEIARGRPGDSPQGMPEVAGLQEVVN
ncbi:hypothetical protein BHE74_00034446 [Ensete ventricosum]|nr:hypothetical protein BHE74_00034446 [Ensete ventricosum]